MIFTYRKGFHVEQYRIAVGFSRSLAVGFKKKPGSLNNRMKHTKTFCNQLVQLQFKCSTKATVIQLMQGWMLSLPYSPSLIQCL